MSLGPKARNAAVAPTASRPDSDLQSGRERDWEVGLDAHLQGAAVDPPHGLGGSGLESGDQAELVDGERAQVVDESSYLGHGVAQVGADRMQESLRLLGLVSHQVPGCVCGENHAGQQGADTIVQVPAQPTAFLLPCRDQPFAGGLERGSRRRG